MMKLPKINTLRHQIFFISSIMTCILLILLGKLIIESFKNYDLSEDYTLKNEITNHLNSAAIWHALERSYGATIIESGEGDSSPLFINFLEAAKKGDAEVLQADKKIKKLLSAENNKAFEDKRYSRIKGYNDLVDARPRVAYKNIPKYEWLEIATRNINNEFDLRNITFAPQKRDEEILILVFTIIAFISFIWWIRRQIMKPIYKLTETTQEIIQGNLSLRAEVRSKNEIGTLANNLNKMAEDLINANRDWESTFNSIGDIITLYDKDHRLIKFNTALTSSLNIKPEYNAARKCYDFTHNKDDDVLFEAPIKEVIQTRRPVMVEVERPDIGSFFSVSSFPCFNNNNEFIGTVQVMRDITERKAAEDRLREINSFNESLINALPFGMDIVDEEGNVLYMSEKFIKLFGRKSLGQKCWSLYRDNKKQCELCPLKKGHKADKNKQIVTEGILGNKIFRISHIDITYNGGKAMLEIFNDITDLKHMEQQLLQSQKMESIGQLAAGIAHEINTPTQFISDNTFFLQDAFNKISTLLKKYLHLFEMTKAGTVKPELINEIGAAEKDINLKYLVEEIPEAIKESQDGLKRITEIVQSMKTFSHPNVEEKVFVDINEMIKSTITVSRNEWKYVADLETDFDADLPSVPCYPSEFNQVILNLIINATHAIGEVSGNGGAGKGKIVISTRHAGDWAEIHISDTGNGIPEEIRTRIFEPFFTTKEVGKGTGQGLSIAHSVVVKRHKGRITFNSVVGKGTTFIIQLPIGTSQAEGKKIKTTSI